MLLSFCEIIFWSGIRHDFVPKKIYSCKLNLQLKHIAIIKPIEMMISRRRFLAAGAIGLGGLVVAERAWDYFSESKVKAKTVIVGGGAAGITMAAYLTDKLRYDDITLIEPNEIHHYQPGYTMVAAGTFKPDGLLKPTQSLIPRGVRWVKDSVMELDPDNNAVITSRNGKINYDFLVLVPGCVTDFNQIEGIAKENLGKGNVHTIYDYQGAILCYNALQELPARKEGRLVFTDTYTQLKCGGAPKKITLLTEDYLKKQKSRQGFQLDFYCNSTNLMTPKIFGDRLQVLHDERNIAVHYKHRLVSVDTSAKKAVFQVLEEPTQARLPVDASAELVTVDFDFLHFTPPMGAPDFVKNSPLATTEGSLRHGGWAVVDNETLVNPKYNNIIILGDVAALDTSKTGAAIRIQAPVAAANLVSIMEGKEPELKYNGYSACPIVTEYGKVLMCEFGYDKELMPSIPFLDPGIERGMWWVLKAHGLKPMYYHGMLKGLM
jgi:sulfide:quinone oxidoreductase